MQGGSQVQEDQYDVFLSLHNVRFNTPGFAMFIRNMSNLSFLIN